MQKRKASLLQDSIPMNNKILTVVAILTVACHNNTEYVTVGEEQLSPKLSPCMEDAFAYFIKHEENPDTSTIYMMEFLVGELGFPQDDTLICFCMYDKRHSADGLRGIMVIGDYKVLVFDKQNVGDEFYNADSLMDTDLSGLCLSSSEDMINCAAFVLDGSPYLELLGCQPDDFERIKIDRDPGWICGRNEGEGNQ